MVPGAEQGEAYRNPSLIARAYRWAAAFHFPGEALTGQVHNMLLWRSGAWLILLCALMLYWLRRRLGSLWLCAAPLLGNLLAMALALCHQSFRYVYFVQPLTLCLLLLTVLFDASAGGQPPEPEKNRRRGVLAAGGGSVFVSQFRVMICKILRSVSRMPSRPSSPTLRMVFSIPLESMPSPP